MEEKRILLPYEIPIVTVTHFEAGDCITTSNGADGDMSFGDDSGKWNENIPSGGWS